MTELDSTGLDSMGLDSMGLDSMGLGSTELGFFNRVGHPADRATAYAEAVALAVHAEAVGFGSAWLAQHFLPAPAVPQGGLPSPWILLAQIAALTDRLRLATAVTVLPLEHPVRLAQDVAVLDAVSGGRVELGLGSGLEPDTFELFGRSYAGKYELFDQVFPAFIEALSGKPVNGHALVPAAPEVADQRTWQGAHSHASAIKVAERGLNLILDANAVREGSTAAEVQAEWLDAWRQALPPGLDRRVAVVRAVVPREVAAGPAAFPELDDRVARSAQKAGIDPERLATFEQRLEFLNVLHDDVSAIPERLAADPVVASADELIIQFNPARLGHDHAQEALTALAEALTERTS